MIMSLLCCSELQFQHVCSGTILAYFITICQFGWTFPSCLFGDNTRQMTVWNLPWNINFRRVLLKGRFRDLTVTGAPNSHQNWVFTFLHLYCMCELKSVRNFESMPLLNYKSVLTSDVWRRKKSTVIFLSPKMIILSNHPYERNSRYTTYKATCVSQTAWFIVQIGQVYVCHYLYQK